MRNLSWERLKFYLLIALIMTSIIQVGILWTYQDYGFPINFLGRKSNADSKYDEKAVKGLLDPFRIIISEGSGDLEKDEPSQWIITDNKEADYIKFWEDAKNYLVESVSAGQKPAVSEIKDWSSLALAEKTIIFDFKTKINQDLLQWLFDIKKISENIPIGINKIIVSPWQNTGVLYISDEINTYAYSLNIDEKTLESYDEIFNRYSTSENKNLRKFTFIKFLSPNGEIKNFDEDVLVVVKGGQYSGIKDVSWAFPDSIRAEKAYSQHQVDEIANVLLGAEKDGYDRNINSSDSSIEFKTQNKIYKLNSEGNLEYKFLTDFQETDKGDLKSALINSYKLLTRIKSLVSADSEVYLSKVIENARGSYTLKFDYIVDGTPVVFTTVEDNGKDKPVITAEPGITIEVNKKGIISCMAKMRKFSRSKSEGLYNVYFGDLQVELKKRYEEFQDNEETMVKDLRISYNVNGSTAEIKPVWVLDTLDKSYVVPMHSK
ncbi:MAG: hypothetical protein N3B21_08915 [Clostridia bacterium]|nr:hypothetical protein [Clostridia bacterium]